MNDCPTTTPHEAHRFYMSSTGAVSCPGITVNSYLRQVFTVREIDLIAAAVRADQSEWQRFVDVMPTNRSMERIQECQRILDKIRGEEK